MSRQNCAVLDKHHVHRHHDDKEHGIRSDIKPLLNQYQQIVSFIVIDFWLDVRGDQEHDGLQHTNRPKGDQMNRQ